MMCLTVYSSELSQLLEIPTSSVSSGTQQLGLYGEEQNPK